MIRSYMRILSFLAVAVLLGGAVSAVSIPEAKGLQDGAQVSLERKTATTDANDFRPTLPEFSAGTKVGTVQLAAINEASGLAASRKNANVLWAHNDSGDSARVFAISTSGQHLGVYNLSGATATDWEDMAIGPGPVSGQDYLYLGDIGDNYGTRNTIRVYRVPEPVVSSTQEPVTVNLTGVETFTLQYEDGARDAETLMVDPTNEDLYIISKREAKSRLYRAARSSLLPGQTVTLRFKAELPWGWATGGDIAPKGNEIAVRGYSNASVWTRPPGTNLWDAFNGKAYTVPIKSEPQGEAIAYDANGQGYYTTSEGANQPIYYYARKLAPAPAFFYLEEPDRSSGIRIATSPADVPGLVRGSAVNVTGTLATTPNGERQLVDCTASIAP